MFYEHLKNCNFSNFLALSNFQHSATIFQNVISLINIYQFSKSQTVLESSHHELLDSHITSSKPSGFDEDMKGFVENTF